MLLVLQKEIYHQNTKIKQSWKYPRLKYWLLEGELKALHGLLPSFMLKCFNIFLLSQRSPVTSVFWHKEILSRKRKNKLVQYEFCAKCLLWPLPVSGLSGIFIVKSVPICVRDFVRILLPKICHIWWNQKSCMNICPLYGPHYKYMWLTIVNGSSWHQYTIFFFFHRSWLPIHKWCPYAETSRKWDIS